MVRVRILWGEGVVCVVECKIWPEFQYSGFRVGMRCLCVGDCGIWSEFQYCGGGSV